MVLQPALRGYTPEVGLQLLPAQALLLRLLWLHSVKAIMWVVIYWWVLVAAFVGAVGFNLLVSPFTHVAVLWVAGIVTAVVITLRLLLNGTHVI